MILILGLSGFFASVGLRFSSNSRLPGLSHEQISRNKSSQIKGSKN
ncbi:hypothetical protein HMPREF1981_03098 [Bacteroides pyogenes F0041]|uniref:Uncharacterized protein n=1 Tax=Bacteroides pyogenes F0041 TaxID=1321819 RepID=U2CC07_9BACE|nr:hypothetical protein HMPREF1981_03098 [Bacteroides pyogenes F0041]